MAIKLCSVLIFVFTWTQLQAMPERSLPGGKTGPLIQRDGYALRYNSACKIPHWVSYVVRSSDLIKNASRTNDFRSDPEIKSPQASLDDYSRSGYDRGHMARAGLFTRAQKLMSESFILSNIVPQNSYMNQQGAWRKLEDFEEAMIKNHKEVHIVSGPVMDGNMQRIGPGGVCVPNHVFKVIYKEGPRPAAIAFIIPNYRTSLPFTDYAVRVNELETQTGIDFLPELPDSLEEKIEGDFSISEWLP